MKKVGFASGEVSLLRRVLGDLPVSAQAIHWTSKDIKAAATILAKLDKAEQKTDPPVNAPAIEETLIAYSRGKVVPLALPNWQRYARQGATAGATVQDAQTIGDWMSRQDWLKPGGNTLQSVLNNWSNWLGKARAALPQQRAPEGFNGRASDVGPAPATQRQGPAGRRPAPGFR